MCVVALALDHHPCYRLVLAANRDEYHARPSAALVRWEGADRTIIAGRDLLSGGTWLGVSEAGRIAIVTNIRSESPPDPAKLSRGALVADYLRGAAQPALPALDDYNAFSLLTIGSEGAMLSANRPTPMIETLVKGLHGLSNGTPQEPWPRKERLMQAFADCLNAADDLPTTLFALLASESIDDSIFIRSPVYGTRCSTVVLVGHDGRGTISERSFGSTGEVSTVATLSFEFDQ